MAPMWRHNQLPAVGAGNKGMNSEREEAGGWACWVRPEASSYKRQEHRFGWRDLADTGLRWRQLSQPDHPSLWIDKKTDGRLEDTETFITMLVFKDVRVTKYFCYFDRYGSVQELRLFWILCCSLNFVMAGVCVLPTRGG